MASKKLCKTHAAIQRGFSVWRGRAGFRGRLKKILGKDLEPIESVPARRGTWVEWFAVNSIFATFASCNFAELCTGAVETFPYLALIERATPGCCFLFWGGVGVGGGGVWGVDAAWKRHDTGVFAAPALSRSRQNSRQKRALKAENVPRRSSPRTVHRRNVKPAGLGRSVATGKVGRGGPSIILPEVAREKRSERV